MISLVNTGGEEATVRCRLYVGRRTPEIDCKIPAYGARMLHVEGVFSKYVGLPKDKTVQAYLRITTPVEVPLGVQLLEKNSAYDEKDYFVAVS